MRYVELEGIAEANKRAEKEDDMQGVRNSAVGLKNVIEAINEKWDYDMTDEICEYLKEN